MPTSILPEELRQPMAGFVLASLGMVKFPPQPEGYEKSPLTSRLTHLDETALGTAKEETELGSKGKAPGSFTESASTATRRCPHFMRLT